MPQIYNPLILFNKNFFCSKKCVSQDKIFSTVTGYDELDKRIMKIKNQKEHLLVVLENPEVPLHNNRSELGARTQVRKRDISFQTINEKCTQSKDMWNTIIQTALQNKVNIFAYIYDQISKMFKMESLVDTILKYKPNTS